MTLEHTAAEAEKEERQNQQLLERHQGARGEATARSSSRSRRSSSGSSSSSRRSSSASTSAADRRGRRWTRTRRPGSQRPVIERGVGFGHAAIRDGRAAELRGRGRGRRRSGDRRAPRRAPVRASPSPLLAVARFFVDIQPPGAKELVVALFGEADKVAFQVFIVIVALGGRRRWSGASADRRPTSRQPSSSACSSARASSPRFASLGVGAVFSAAVAGLQALVGISAAAIDWSRSRNGSATPAGRARAGAVPPRATACPTGAAAPCSRSAARSRSAPSSPGPSGRYLLERQRAPVAAGERSDRPEAGRPPGRRGHRHDGPHERRALPRSSSRTTTSTGSTPRSSSRPSTARRGRLKVFGHGRPRGRR